MIIDSGASLMSAEDDTAPMLFKVVVFSIHTIGNKDNSGNKDFKKYAWFILGKKYSHMKKSQASKDLNSYEVPRRITNVCGLEIT